MATAEDSKLKFLPRHLQRSTPAAASHKSKRRVTVEDDSVGDEESDRRSVFDRLGPGGSQRSESKKPCFEFQQHGKCHLGKNCIYSHISKHRTKRDGNKSPDNLRLTFKGEKDKENKVRSQVVVRKNDADSDAESGDESDSLSIDNLKQKRQEIQRALIALEEGEEVVLEPKKSESSELDTSPEIAHKKKRDKSRKKEKKKHKKETGDKEQFVEKPKDGKRKHDVDDNEVVPHKKHKKKNKDKKNVEESPPPAVTETFVKQKRVSQVKGGKAAVDLYDPASPTSVARPGSLDDHSSSSSAKVKGKNKKKKKKHVKSPGQALGKSKKLLSPLRKVLKKKGRDSVDSSKRSRSVSRSTPQRKRSRSSSSSSDSSSSTSPVRQRQPVSGGRDLARKKSVEVKRKGRSTRRSQSSSSSTSSSSSSVSSDRERGRRRMKQVSHVRGRSGSLTTKGHSPASTGMRKDMRSWKRKQEPSLESRGRGKDRDSDKKKGGRHSVDRGRDKLRDKKEDREVHRPQSSHVLKESLPDFREKRRGIKDGKLDKDIFRPGAGRRDLKVADKDISRPGAGRRDLKVADKDIGRPGPGRRDVKEADKDIGRPSLGRRDMKEADKDIGRPSIGRRDMKESGKDRIDRRDENRDMKESGKDRIDRRDENRDKEGARGDNRDGNLKDRNRDRRGGSLDRDRDDRNKRGGSLDRDREERNRRGGAGFPIPHGQQGERGARFTRGAADDDRDRDRRHFEEGPARFPANEGQRMGQFQGDRDRLRAGFDRGQGRGSENQGRDARDWDERDRREGGGGGDTFRDDWQGGRDSRGGFGGYEAGRDERRGAVREERLLPLMTGWGDSGIPPLLDRNLRGPGFRDEYGSRENNERRDWKQRESSQEAATQKRTELEIAPRGRDQSGGDGRLKNAPRPANEVSGKVSGRDSRVKMTEKSDSTATKVRPEAGKEESPMTRDEPSLATLFSQTETAPMKKKPTKSFGGKKSPKKTGEDNKPGEKTKPGFVGRLVVRGKRMPERKDPLTPVVDIAVADIEPEQDGDKAAVKKTDIKDTSGSISPKGSQKSGDSRYSQSKSRRSSKSPVAKPVHEVQRSPRKASRSPAPASRERDHGKTEKPKLIDRGRKRERGRSHSGSGSESPHSSHSGGVEEKSRALSSDNESLPAKLDGGDIAAAMLGDSIDDGQQDVFSEWSDDDETFSLLIDGKRKSQVEDLDHLDNRDFQRSGRPRYSPVNGGRDVRTDQELRPLLETIIERPVLEKNIPNVKIVEDIQKEKPAKEKRGRKPDDEGYEEISSDENELDEEGEKVSKRTIVSILAIDMASLMSTSKPKPMQGPVFERYKAASLFAEMGLSRAYAGEQLYREVQEVCHRRIQEVASSQQTQETIGDIKPESEELTCPRIISDDITSLGHVKTSLGSVAVALTSSPSSLHSGTAQATAVKEDPPGEDKLSPMSQNKMPQKRSVDPAQLMATAGAAPSRPTFTLYGDTSAYHTLNKARAQQRSGLLAHFGIFRRALTARKDLDIRRQLCGIDSKYDQSAVYPSGAVDADTFRQCLQLFKQKKPSVLIAPCGS